VECDGKTKYNKKIACGAQASWRNAEVFAPGGKEVGCRERRGRRAAWYNVKRRGRPRVAGDMGGCRVEKEALLGERGVEVEIMSHVIVDESRKIGAGSQEFHASGR